MSRYLVIVERGRTSYGAYVPDLPGCVAVAKSAEEVRELIGEAVVMHLEELRRQGLPVPAPHSEPAWAEAG